MIREIINIEQNNLILFANLGLKFPANILAALPKRQLQYASGRICAQRALSKFCPNLHQAVQQDSIFRPIWPHGFTGSISHCDQLAVAVVGETSKYQSIGVDLEFLTNCAATIQSIYNLALLPAEQQQYPTDINNYPAILTIFAIKEALYKCLNPIVEIFFDFNAAQVCSLDLKNNHATVCLTQDLSTEYYAGKEFAVYIDIINQDHVLTLISISVD